MRWVPRFVVGLGALLSVAYFNNPTLACPFCTAVNMTLTEEINAAHVAVVVTLAKVPESQQQPIEPDTPLEPCHFTIDEVIKGADVLGADKEKGVKTLYLGQAPIGTKFFMTAIPSEQTKLTWGSPILLPERGPEYIGKILKLPAKGPERIAFFQDYLRDKDDLLASDAYDEFAKTPYEQIKAGKDQLDREDIIAGIKQPETKASFRRLFFSLLSVCGKPEDVPMLEAMIRSTDKRDRSSLDSMLNCYMALEGERAMPLIEELFLKDPAVDYVDRYAAIMAIRFQGTEGKAVPRPVLVKALRLNLDHPKVADLVVADLARWEDWEVMERLVEMFKSADEKTIFIREPVINYLRVCPRPEAKGHLEELAKIDPIAYKRATSLYEFPMITAKTPAEGNKAAALSTTVQAAPTDSAPKDTGPASSKPAAAAPAIKSAPATNSGAAIPNAPPASPHSSDPLPVLDVKPAPGTLGVAIVVIAASLLGAVFIVRRNPGR